MAGTKHAPACVMAFGRYSPQGDCPRCDELRAGAAPRAAQYDYGRKAREEARTLASIKHHFRPGGPHACGKCGPVCTFGDW